jgi:hypothetical protein
MMIQAIVLAMTVGAGGEWSGSVTGATGPVIIQRDQVEYQARQGSGIRNGDRLRTSPQSKGTFLIDDSIVLYLAPASYVELTGEAGQRRIVMLSGEARITCRAETPIQLVTGRIEARAQRAIVRMERQQRQSRLMVEYGNAQVASRNRVEDLAQGQQIQHQQSGFSLARDNVARAGWSIRPAEYQVAAISIASASGRPCTPGPNCPDCAAPADDGQQPDQPQDESREPEPEAPPGAERAGDQPADTPDTGDTFANINANATGSVALGALASVGFGSAASGGLFSDANQQTQQGMLTRDSHGLRAGDPFPGNIHLITGETRYGFNDVRLSASEQAQIFPNGNRSYYSIGVGAPPTSQVTTDIPTASAPQPKTIPIPRFGAYLVRLDQFGVPDAGLDPQAAQNNNSGIAGLVGQQPVAPSINGATPVLDERSELNSRATFALGEFRLRTINGDSIEFAVRRSDQDRLIVKDPNGNDANDLVQPNTQQQQFSDVADPRFLPANPTVKVPTAGQYDSAPTQFSNLNQLRRAALTTLVADELHDFSRRTGQTRFVLQEPDGRQRIIDITGYRRQ